MSVSMHTCRTRLMLLWFAWSSVLLLIMFLQLVFEHYGKEWRDALQWLLPAIIPTTSLVVGVWVNEMAKAEKVDRQIGRSAFRMAALSSALYLLFVSLVIAVQPFYRGSPIELMKQSALILAPLQGVVGAFIGIFFSQAGQQAGSPAAQPEDSAPPKQAAAGA